LLVIVGIDRDNTTAVLPPERVCAAQAGLGRSGTCHESAVDVECVKAARALIETTLTIAGLLAVCPQVRNRCPTASDDTETVELNDADPHLVGRLLEGALVCVAAGHVDQGVDSTERTGCIGERSLD
jgi:hypothetical protein